ncbi:MAG: DUF4190 domain-containing protein [Actinobacteria bacterium]|nr:DUF4190 domain-containing protein [Actinomycetota bacterium]
MSTTPPPPPAMPASGGGNTSENSNGTVALVCGILSFFVCPIILSIVAIIYGKKGMASAAAGRADNGGQAKAGYLMGIISIILSVVAVILYVILGAALLSNSGSMN